MTIENAMEEKDYILWGKVKRKRSKVNQFWVSLLAGGGYISKGDYVFVFAHQTYVPYEVETCQVPREGEMIVTLKGVASANDLPHDNLFVKKESQPARKEEALETYVGYEVYDERGVCLGKVEGVIPRPMQPLLEVDHQGSVLWIPVHRDIVTAVDEERLRIDVTLPTGYLAAYKEVNG